MQMNELIKKVMKEEGVTQMELAERMGTGQRNISQFLSKGSFSSEKAVEMLDAMGYELVAMKKTIVRCDD